MPIKFPCPACQSPIRAPDDVAGQTQACPKCGAPITVPSPAEPGPPAPPPPPSPAAEGDLAGLSNLDLPASDETAAAAFDVYEPAAPERQLEPKFEPPVAAGSVAHSRMQFVLPQFELPLSAKIKHLVGWAVAAALASFVLGAATLILWAMLALAGAVLGGLLSG